MSRHSDAAADVVDGTAGIPMLYKSGDKDNWSIYQMVMEPFLISKGLWDIVNPEESQEELEEDDKVHKKREAQAKQFLLRTCSIELMGRIEARTKNPREIWKAYKELFENPDEETVQAARARYQDCVLSDFDSLE